MLINDRKFFRKSEGRSRKNKRWNIYKKYADDARRLSELGEHYIHSMALLNNKIEQYASCEHIYKHLCSVRDKCNLIAEAECAYYYRNIDCSTLITYQFSTWSQSSTVVAIKLGRACARMDQALEFILYLEENNLTLRSK